MHQKAETWIASCTQSANGDDYPVEPAPESTKALDDRFLFLPDLPDSIGVAGPFVGVHNKALIVAGGANFPEKPLIEGGPKVWHDRIFILEPGNKEWDVRFRLSQPRAYGASASTRHGIVLAGGNDASRDYADAALLQWDASKKEVTERPLPPLPMPMASGRAVAIGDQVYVLSGPSSKHPENDFKAMWVIDLNAPPQEQKWESRQPWPGLPRANMTTASQIWNGSECLFLFSGVHESTNGNGEIERDFHTDAWRYDPNTDTWTSIHPLPSWHDPRSIPDKDRFVGQRASATAAGAVGVGEDSIYLFSGTTGRFILHPDGSMRDLAERPLNPKRILKYDISDDTWSEPGQMPLGGIVTSAVTWNGHVVIPSGEIKPGIRTPRVQALKISDLE